MSLVALQTISANCVEWLYKLRMTQKAFFKENNPCQSVFCQGLLVLIVDFGVTFAEK